MLMLMVMLLLMVLLMLRVKLVLLLMVLITLNTINIVNSTVFNGNCGRSLMFVPFSGARAKGIGVDCSAMEQIKLSSYLVSPRIGNLMQVLHTLHYLLKNDSSWMPMDYTPLDIEYTGPQDASPKARRKVMRRMHRDAREEIPDNVPEFRGNKVQLNV